MIKISNKLKKYKNLIWKICIIFLSSFYTVMSEPVLFFSDLTSGPNIGGQDNHGAFITLFGEGFGSIRGNNTVTIGGREVAKYVFWGENNAKARDMDMIVVQPGSNITSGNIVVTVNGVNSNPLPFTIRNGKIYFVIPDAPNANDNNPGTYTEPFKTLYRPRKVITPGDIIYIKGGNFNTSDPDHPGWDAIMLLAPDSDINGTADLPIAYIGYPGDSPMLGAPAPMRRGLYMEVEMEFYIFAKLEFSLFAGNMNLSGKGHRIIGNYLHDRIYADGLVMGVAGNSSQLKIFGNLLSDNGDSVTWESGVGFYLEGFGTNQDIDFGWNQIKNQGGRRAIQVFGHVNGDRVDNIHIHDNHISGSSPLRNCILLGGSDGDNDILGTIYVYNNIITGAEGQGLRINDPQGTVFIRNNLLYNNGSQGFDGHGQIFFERIGAGITTFQNNILYAESGQEYYDFGSGTLPSGLITSNNLVYNAGPCPSWDVDCINGNPLFRSLATGDFRITELSPAINTGINTGITHDFIGIQRPQGNRYDIGVFEFTGVNSINESGKNKISVSISPNPFSESTSINYELQTAERVKIDIFNSIGEKITTLVDEYQEAGKHSSTFDAGNLPQGMYYYRIQIGNRVESGKLIFIN